MATSYKTIVKDGLWDNNGVFSMLLGMWTTAATFYGLAVVDFPSLEELGLLIGHSMMVCGLLTLVLVPALLPAVPPAVPALTTCFSSAGVAPSPLSCVPPASSIFRIRSITRSARVSRRGCS